MVRFNVNKTLVQIHFFVLVSVSFYMFPWRKYLLVTPYLSSLYLNELNLNDNKAANKIKPQKQNLAILLAKLHYRRQQQFCITIGDSQNHVNHLHMCVPINSFWNLLTFIFSQNSWQLCNSVYYSQKEEQILVPRFELKIDSTKIGHNLCTIL